MFLALQFHEEGFTCGSSLFSSYYKCEDFINTVLVDGWFHPCNWNHVFLIFIEDKSFQVPLKESFLGET
jgi:hypothetical protein